MSRVTALCWAQAFSPCLDSAASCKNRPAVESLLVGRLDGSLCWLQVTMQEIDLHVESTELTHCNIREGEQNKWENYTLTPNAIEFNAGIFCIVIFISSRL